jgi:hypothetical protein
MEAYPTASPHDVVELARASGRVRGCQQLREVFHLARMAAASARRLARTVVHCVSSQDDDDPEGSEESTEKLKVAIKVALRRPGLPTGVFDGMELPEEPTVSPPPQEEQPSTPTGRTRRQSARRARGPWNGGPPGRTRTRATSPPTARVPPSTRSTRSSRGRGGSNRGATESPASPEPEPEDAMDGVQTISSDSE